MASEDRASGPEGTPTVRAARATETIDRSPHPQRHTPPRAFVASPATRALRRSTALRGVVVGRVSERRRRPVPENEHHPACSQRTSPIGRSCSSACATLARSSSFSRPSRIIAACANPANPAPRGLVGRVVPGSSRRRRRRTAGRSIASPARAAWRGRRRGRRKWRWEGRVCHATSAIRTTQGGRRRAIRAPPPSVLRQTRERKTKRLAVAPPRLPSRVSSGACVEDDGAATTRAPPRWRSDDDDDDDNDGDNGRRRTTDDAPLRSCPPPPSTALSTRGRQREARDPPSFPSAVVDAIQGESDITLAVTFIADIFLKYIFL